MELLAGVGLAAKSLFDYNRENFKFDQNQSLQRELLRAEMCVKRFELFREDVRDLQSLTVGRMDAYHVAGALFLEFCMVLFVQGRIEEQAADHTPPFLLCLFLLSNACAFIYILLAVWLSMHASVASHSFGVRLLTRFVRLPIPSSKQLESITSKLAEFEFQDVESLMRMPFQGRQQNWKRPPETSPESLPTASQTELSAFGAAGAGGLPAAAVGAAAAAAPAAAAGAGAGAGAGGAGEAPSSQPVVASIHEQAESPFLNEEFLLQPGLAPGRHVVLFRRIQAKWLCYDAYCRVCMALGMNQILQGLSYYAILITMVEHHSPTGGLAVIAFFQAAALSLSILDISGLRRWAVVAMQCVAALPAFCAWLSIAWKLSSKKKDCSQRECLEDAHADYPLTPLVFLMEAVWLNVLLWLAEPSTDGSFLPRRFRSVLFLDVFGDAIDPTEAEGKLLNQRSSNKLSNGDGAEEDYLEEVLLAERIVAAEEALHSAQTSLARWQAVPTCVLSNDQALELQRLASDLELWRGALRTELAWRAAKTGLPHATSAWDDAEDMRPWGEIPLTMQDEDPFAGSLLGPFEHDVTGYRPTLYYYDVERRECVQTCRGQVLPLELVSALVRSLEAAVRLLLAMSDSSASQEQDTDVEADASSSPTTPTSNGITFGPMLTQTQGKVGDTLRAGFRNLKKLKHQLRRRAMIDYAETIDVSSSLGLNTPLLGTQSHGTSSQPVGSLSLSRPTGPEAGMAGPLPADTQPEAVASGSMMRADSNKLHQDQYSHFVPATLPWTVLQYLTRLLQVCWTFAAFMSLVRSMRKKGGWWSRTWIYALLIRQTGHGSGSVPVNGSTGNESSRNMSPANAWIEAEARRLYEERMAVHTWQHLQELEVGWAEHMTAFIHPMQLSCLPVNSSSSSLREVVLGTSFGTYMAKVQPPKQLVLEPAMGIPGDAVWMCPPSRLMRTTGCLLAHIGGHDVEIWPWHPHEASFSSPSSSSSSSSSRSMPRAPSVRSKLRMPGNAWRGLTGGIVACSDVSALALPRQPQPLLQDEAWCLLLAGWDGRGVPVIVEPLRDLDGRWHLARPLSPSKPLQPRVYLPLQGNAACKDRRLALFLVPERLQIRALMSDAACSNSAATGMQEQRWDLSCLHGGTTQCEHHASSHARSSMSSSWLWPEDGLEDITLVSACEQDDLMFVAGFRQHAGLDYTAGGPILGIGAITS